MDGDIQAVPPAGDAPDPGAEGAVEELRRYGESRFDLAVLENLGRETVLPLPDEPFVATWDGYAAEARSRGVFAVLQERLPQLAFPVRAGLSETEGYRAATRRGAPVAGIAEATGLLLEDPAGVELTIHPSPAGRIPVLVARRRADFVTLIRALTKRGEPVPVPDSQGALMVAGFNNWDRLNALRRAWEASDPAGRETATWAEEMARLLPHRELYQDRFILLSDGPYSAVPAAAMDMDDAAWRALSLVIRRDHESAHYFTRRLFGSMRNNLHDELLADYAGISAAAGRFHASWFLRFLGLEDFPTYRPGGRLEIYRGDPPLSDRAFALLGAQVVAAAANLERFDQSREARPASTAERALDLATIASLTLADLAADDGAERLRRAAADLAARQAGQARQAGRGSPSPHLA